MDDLIHDEVVVMVEEAGSELPEAAKLALAVRFSAYARRLYWME